MKSIDDLDRLFTPQRLRYPWFIGSALWAGWLLSLLLGKGITDLAGHLIGTDFVAFYTAGKIVLTGQSAHLYDLELAHTIQQEIYAAPSENFNPYLNPPFYAWLFVPFALLPYPISAVLWMSAGLVLFWFSLRWLGVEKPGYIFLLSLTWLPAFSAVSFGQNAFLSLGLFALTYCLWKKEHRLAAGLVSGLLIYKPQLLLGLGFFWLLEWRKNWRCLLGMALSGATLAGASLLWMPQATFEYLNYAQKIAANLMTVAGFPMWNAHAVQAFWLALFPGQKTLSQALYLVCAAAGLWVFVRLWRQIRPRGQVLFGAALCLTVWLTPYMMIYDWVLLLIPAVLFWQYQPRVRKEWRLLYALLWITTFLSSVLTFGQLHYLGRAIQLSIPVLAWVFWQAYRLLTAPSVDTNIVM